VIGKLDQRVVIAGAGAGVLLVALVGYLLVISPQRSKVHRLDARIEQTQHELDIARMQRANKVETVRVADLFRLTKAMPDSTRMPDLLLQLSRVARDAGIEFDAVTPQTPVSQSAYSSIPIQLVFQGNFYELSDFLYRLRNLVGVHDGRLDTSGRLFDVGNIEFIEGEDGFPKLKANLTVDAFVYGTSAGSTPAGGGGTTETTTQTSTTPAETATSPSQTTSPPAASAALGAIP
jgi:hypothetical protein